MRVTGTAYPWDVVGDDGFVDALRTGGIGELVLAAAYHAVRAATPRHPATVLVEAEHAAFYLPRREGAWAGQRIQPVPPGSWARDDAFLRAADAARAAGMPVAAWVVLTHSRAVGERHPDLAVTSAFGDRYLYALCPANEDVRAYAATVASETIAQSGVERIVLEACGPLGVDHQGTHEKTSGADWSATQRDLLSICFCGACRQGYRAAGEDPDELARRVREAVRTEAARAPEAIGAALWALVLSVRAAARTRMSEQVTAAARAAGAASIASHGSLIEGATGPFAQTLADGVERDVVLLPGGEARATGAEGIAQATADLGCQIGVAENVAAGELDAVRERLRADRGIGAAELSVGHLGLLGRRRLAAVLSAVR